MVLAVGINGHWRLPLAYCLTDGTNAELQETLLRSVICKLWDCGCLAISVTMDGLAANQKTFKNLGACLDPGKLVSIFPHPHPDCCELKVAAIFDACHMMKLARNCLNEYQILTIPGTGKVKWQHIQLLHNKQVSEGLNLANKLSKSHLEFKTQKMKVKLAVQVISASCAKAMEFLRKSNVKEFQDSLATELFLLRLDRLFDYLNCRSPIGKGFKSPTNVNNAVMRIAFLRETKDFLLTMQDSTGVPVVQTRRRMFVIGLCITIDSIIYLIEKLLLGDGLNGVKMRFLLSYKQSQDHIEIVFGTIRRRGGWSNNPTALQFRACYRGILSHVGVVPSENSNCTVDAADDILQDQCDVNSSQEEEMFINSHLLCDDHSYASLLPLLSKYVANVCSYIAGFIVRRLIPKLKCSKCRELLVDASNLSTSCCSFLQLRNNGGLIVPSTGVIRIVQVAEQHLRSMIPQEKAISAISQLGPRLEIAVIKNIDCCSVFGPTTTSHMSNTVVGINNHISSLIRQIVRFYLDIRKFHIVRNFNIQQKGAIIRQSMTKLVLFKNQ